MADTKDKIKEGIDDAAHKAKEATDKAAHKVSETAHNVGEKVKETGEKIKFAGNCSGRHHRIPWEGPRRIYRGGPLRSQDRSGMEGLSISPTDNCQRFGRDGPK